jgi:hypothetical protein
MRYLLVLLLAALISACSQSPMDKLKSDYIDMSPPKWSEQHDQHTALWDEALAYCKEHGNKPNCGLVMQVYVIDNGSTKIPAYGSSGHYLTVPSFDTQPQSAKNKEII